MLRNESKFKDQLKSYMEEQQWTTLNTSEFELLSTTKINSLFRDEFYDELEERQLFLYVDKDVFEETVSNSGYALSVNDTVFPVMEIGVTSVLDATGLSAGGLQKAELTKMVDFVNHMYKQLGTDCKVLTFSDRIAAVLSKNYRQLDVDRLIKILEDSLENGFVGYRFRAGEVSYSLVKAQYEIFDSGIRKALKNENYKLKPVVTFVSSDIGLFTASLFPSVMMEDRIIPFGEPLKLKHHGKADYDMFEEDTKKIYSLFKKSKEAMDILTEVEIKYPDACLNRVMDSLRFGQKEKAFVLRSKTENLGESSKINALDLYFCITELLEEKNDKKEFARIQYEEKINRALFVDWKSYDLPAFEN